MDKFEKDLAEVRTMFTTKLPAGLFGTRSLFMIFIEIYKERFKKFGNQIDKLFQKIEDITQDEVKYF